MCRQFGYTKQAYYKQLSTVETATVKEEIIVGLIKKKREIWKRGSGRNLHKSLQEDFAEHQLKVGRDKFFNILRSNKLLVKTKSRKAGTTMSYHRFRKYKNLIQNTIPQRANEIWVSDITYLWLKERDRFCYLSLITDMYSRKIIGHCVYESLSVKGCLIALKEALKKAEKDTTGNLIHHSDRGIQYCCHAYTGLLTKNNIRISMTQSGDPLENAIAERVNKTIKEEFTTDKQINFCNIETAKKEIGKFIEFYNTKRPHRSLNWLTPAKAHLEQGVLKRMWRNYKSKQEHDALITV